jgi:hypothetical protein
MSNSRRRTKRPKRRTEKQRRYSAVLTKERMALDSKFDPDWLMGHPPSWHKILLRYGRDEGRDPDLRQFNKRVFELFSSGYYGGWTSQRLHEELAKLGMLWDAGWRPEKEPEDAA